MAVRHFSRIMAFCGFLGAAALMPAAAYAADCGEQPVDQPTLPDGALADADDMRVARDAVIEYSDAVDSWLRCMDDRSTKLAPFMTREQRARLSEDLSKVHLDRQVLQRGLNEQIRAYRKANQNG